MKYCPCGYPIVVDERWNGLAWVLDFRDGRTNAEISECPNCGESETAWLWLPPGSENLHLKPGALLDEAPQKCNWDDVASPDFDGCNGCNGRGCGMSVEEAAR
ncbi:MAG: hypothetical protein ACOYYI_01680 [Chloroflexota bacterium]